MKLKFVHSILLVLLLLSANTPLVTNAGFEIHSIETISDSTEVNASPTELTSLLVHTNSILNTEDVNQTDELFLSPQIEVFPNPATEKITIQPKGISGKLKVNIYNSLGKLVKLSRLNTVDEPYDISLSGMARGVYYVKLIDGNTVIETKKLIVRK